MRKLEGGLWIREIFDLGPLWPVINVKSLRDVPLSLCMILSLPNREASEIVHCTNIHTSNLTNVSFT